MLIQRPRRIRNDRGGGILARTEHALVLVIVLVAGGVLLSLYQGQRRLAADMVAGARVRQAAVAIAAWRLDHDGYLGMTPDALRAGYDAVLDQSVELEGVTDAGYCVQVTSLGRTWRQRAPGAPAELGAC